MLKKDIIVTFGGQVARVIFATISAALLARALGPDNRGLFALAILLPRTAEVLFKFGQDAVNNTYAGLYRDQRPALFAQTMLFGIVFGALSALALVTWFFWLPFDQGIFEKLPASVVLLAIFLCPAETLQHMLEALTRGCERIGATVVVTTIGVSLLCLGYAVFLMGLGLGLKAAMWVTLAVPLITVALLIWQVRDFATIDVRKLAWPLLLRSLRFGGLRMIGAVAMFLVARVTMYLLGFMLISEAEIGLYAVALTVSDQLKLVPTSVAQAFLPRLSNNPETRLAQTPMVFRYTAIASWATALGIAIIAAPAVIILFGWDYAGSIVPILIMLPGLATFGGNRVLGMDLWVRDKPIYGMINNWASLVVTAVASLLLIPLWGIIGAAAANTLGLFTLSILTYWAYNRESRVPLSSLMISIEDFRGMRRQLRDVWRKAASKLRRPARAPSN